MSRKIDEPAILDLGGFSIKAGFPSDGRHPRGEVLTVFANPKGPGIMVGEDLPTWFYGQEALNRRGILRMTYPIARGVVGETAFSRSWGPLGRLISYMLDEVLNVSSCPGFCDPGDPQFGLHGPYASFTPPMENDHPRCVFLTEATLAKTLSRERMVSHMFEKARVESLYLGDTGRLSLLASGETTGISLEIGDGLTAAVPVLDGHSIRSAVQKIHFGGKDLLSFFVNTLERRGIELWSSKDRATARQEILEKRMYVASDYIEECSQFEATGHANQEFLFLGDDFQVGKERFLVPEVLFQPSLWDKNSPSVQSLVTRAIEAIGSDTESPADHFSRNVFVAGGASSFDGFDARLRRELSALIPEMTWGVSGPPKDERRFAVFHGATVVASLSSFPKLCMTKEEYDECGTAVLLRKGFVSSGI